MYYKYELHCHTSEVSVCARVPAPQVAEEHIKAGYDGIVITNHINFQTFWGMEALSWKEKIDYFLEGWRLAKQTAGDRMQVFLGLELALKNACNDYLIYGLDEDFLYGHPDLDCLSLEQLSALTHKHSLLLIQAHPFRNQMTIMPPSLLDGIEICNANPRHDSRNDIAHFWAEKFGLLTTSGSDYHQLEDIGRGGILLPKQVHSIKELTQALRGDKILLELQECE